MKQILNKIYTLLLVCATSTSWGQSLQEFINRALENNYQIRIMKNEALVASNNNTAGNAGQLPTVDLEGSASRSYNNTNQQLADGSVREGSNAQSSDISASATANWTVFDGFRVQAKKDGSLNLRESGYEKVRLGLTSIPEVIAATTED